MAKKYSLGSKVVFSYEGATKFGTIERREKFKKTIRYAIRGEDARLYPPMGVDTKVGPGKIMSKLTEKMFGTETLKSTGNKRIVVSDVEETLAEE